MTQPTASTDLTAGGDSKGDQKEGLSQFLTDILKQLNVSAWLPAIMWVCVLTLMLKLHIRPKLGPPSSHHGDHRSGLDSLGRSLPVGAACRDGHSSVRI